MPRNIVSLFKRFGRQCFKTAQVLAAKRYLQLRMDLNKLIPEHKFDTEKVELLNDLTFEQIEPIICNLLEWLQDGNWPVSRPLGNYLKTLSAEKLGPYLLEILNGNDYEWKYFLIAILGDKINGIQYQPFLDEIYRIASHPTEIEKRCELDEIAKLMLE